MEITDDVVRSIAELAQLKVDRHEIEALAAGMKNILDLAEQMQQVDTSGIEPVSNPLDATQQLRPDIVTEPDQRKTWPN